jgi:hypothetical protein
MAILGYHDLRDNSLPALWDEDYLMKVAMQEGVSFAEVVAEAQVALMALNNSLTDMPHYSGMLAVQDDVMVEYDIGSSNAFEVATEYGRPDPQRASTTGHMLPIKPYDYGMGWTMMYLRKARRPRLEAGIRALATAAKAKVQQLALTRLFSTTAGSVGSTSSDVPLADGGSADSTYIPPVSPEGEEFASSHSHFIGYSDSNVTQNTINQAAIDGALENLQEHGFQSPFDIVGARVDASKWADKTAVTGWVAPDFSGITRMATTDKAAIGDITQYFGFIETDYGVCRLWLTPRVPTYHFAVYKELGFGDAFNPLRMRIDPTFGFGFNLVPGNWVNAPLEMLVAYTEMGIGIGNRVNGVCVDVAASTYSAPTIS